MTEITARSDRITVVIDAHCGLCASGARWLARRDQEERFQIAPMHSVLGRNLFEAYGIDPDDPGSWLYMENGRALTGFEGWARVGQVLGGTARILTLLLLIPRPLRARLYSTIARNRIRLSGTDDLCNLPDPAVAARLVQ